MTMSLINIMMIMNKMNMIPQIIIMKMNKMIIYFNKIKMSNIYIIKIKLNNI